MRFLADENVEEPVIARLRRDGHDVLLARALRPVSADADLLERAAQEQRVLVTNDKDFGELTFLQRRASHGIVLVRMPAATSTVKAERVGEVLAEVGDRLRGAMVVVEAQAWRRRSLPGRPV